MPETPDPTRVTAAAKKLPMQNGQGSENAYRAAFIEYRDRWNETPGLPFLMNR